MKKIPINSLNPLAYNPRVIGKKNFSNLRKSIITFSGAVKGDSGELRLIRKITVNSIGNRVISGHQRIKALLAEGQDWIHEDDINWVKIPPDSPIEKTLNLVLNDERFQGTADKERHNALLHSIFDADEELYKDLNLPEISVGEFSSLDPKDKSEKEEKEKKDEKDEEQENDGDTLLVGVSFSVRQNQLEYINQVLAIVKKEFGIGSDSGAILKICAEYLEIC